MNKVRKIDEGCGLEVVVLHKGKPKRFRLAVVEAKSIFGGSELSFVYIDDKHEKVINSFYSGGITGGGGEIRDWEEFKKAYYIQRIVSTDIEEIIEISEKEEEKITREKEEHERKMKEKAERINRLPKIKEVEVEGLIFKMERSDATYNSAYNSRWIQGPFISVFLNDKDVWVTHYRTKSGAIKVKNFARELTNITGKSYDWSTAKRIFVKIWDEYKKYKEELEKA